MTDLCDAVIVDLVTQIFWRAGKESMKTLDAGELSNLVWAIARLANEKSTSAGYPKLLDMRENPGT